MKIHVSSDKEFKEGDAFNPLLLLQKAKIKVSHSECLGGKMTWEGDPTPDSGGGPSSYLLCLSCSARF